MKRGKFENEPAQIHKHKQQNYGLPEVNLSMKKIIVQCGVAKV